MTSVVSDLRCISGHIVCLKTMFYIWQDVIWFHLIIKKDRLTLRSRGMWNRSCLWSSRHRSFEGLCTAVCVPTASDCTEVCRNSTHRMPLRQGPMWKSVNTLVQVCPCKLSKVPIQYTVIHDYTAIVHRPRSGLFILHIMYCNCADGLQIQCNTITTWHFYFHILSVQ